VDSLNEEVGYLVAVAQFAYEHFHHRRPFVRVPAGDWLLLIICLHRRFFAMLVKISEAGTFNAIDGLGAIVRADFNQLVIEFYADRLLRQRALAVKAFSAAVTHKYCTIVAFAGRR
jgi:hypothetical protein